MNILVAMSGGVDSSVAAKLLADAGNCCTGCTMKLYTNEDAGIPRGHTCCSLDDVEDARSVAARLGMRYYVFNFSEDFEEKVVGKFVSSYRHGRTPNPCIDCNRFMKFDKLFERARLLGCDHVATGHYARIEEQNGEYILKKALDASKDQSYVLYTMTQEQLAHTLFPLGALPKTQTRAIAEEAGFWNAHKPDSQDICFVPDGDYAAAIERLTGERSEPGDFVDRQGHVLGRHSGIIRYTVGQHRGLGLGQSEKRYVCALCPEENTVVLGGADELFSRTAGRGWTLTSRSAPLRPDRPLFCTMGTSFSAAERSKERNKQIKIQPERVSHLRLLIFQEAPRARPGRSRLFSAMRAEKESG